ncbi:hypothetical protein Q1695_003117 [Nippostrongylus brasiliensis]|nr:hypothetical protein Q1695_003117 [Nippostrongylus brasiliensis]
MVDSLPTYPGMHNFLNDGNRSHADTGSHQYRPISSAVEQLGWLDFVVNSYSSPRNNNVYGDNSIPSLRSLNQNCDSEDVACLEAATQLP